MICPSCGKNVSANQEFCTYCGAQTQFSSKIRYFPQEVPVAGAQKPVLQPASRQEDALREKERMIAAQAETIKKQKESVSIQRKTIAKQKRLIVLFAVLAAVALLAACVLGCMFALRACKGATPAADPVPEETEQPTEGTEDTETSAPSGDPIAVETADPSETESPAPESPAPESPAPESPAPDATATESPAPTETPAPESKPAEETFRLKIKGGETHAIMEKFNGKDCLRVDLFLDGLKEKDLLSSIAFTLSYDANQLGYEGYRLSDQMLGIAAVSWIIKDQDGKLTCAFVSTEGKQFKQDEPVLTLYFTIGESVSDGDTIRFSFDDANKATIVREGSEKPEEYELEEPDLTPFVYTAKK